AAASCELPPRVVRRAAGQLPAMRLGGHRAAVRIRLDRMQGAVALQELPRAVRLFQVSLIGTDMTKGLSLRAKRSNPDYFHGGSLDCFGAEPVNGPRYARTRWRLAMPMGK